MNLILPDKVYDILKWIVILFLPASATLYNTLALIWKLPYAEEITKTITAIVTFLGAVLMISNYNYKKKEE